MESRTTRRDRRSSRCVGRRSWLRFKACAKSSAASCAGAFHARCLIVVIVVKELFIATSCGWVRRKHCRQTDAWHHRTDAMTSIAAFVGISIALIGGEKWQKRGCGRAFRFAPHRNEVSITQAALRKSYHRAASELGFIVQATAGVTPGVLKSRNVWPGRWASIFMSTFISE